VPNSHDLANGKGMTGSITELFSIIMGHALLPSRHNYTVQYRRQEERVRVKTEDRRQAILQAAMAVFREGGYERASMAEIAARVGGSKATLYGYFASKEELYAAAMFDSAREEATKLEQMLDTSQASITLVLEKFGKSYLYFVTSPDIVAKKRSIFGQGGFSPVGAMLYAGGPKQTLGKLAEYIASQMRAGVLRQANPDIAALHLQGLLEAGIVEPGLFGVPPRFPIEDAVPCAIQAFMAIYGQNHGATCPPA
jgi:AcrR family transcriptional regulator